MHHVGSFYIQMTILRVRIACWIPKATNTTNTHTLRICNTYSFSLQQWLNECACVLLYTYLQCLSRAWGGIVIKELLYWSDGPGIDSRWCHWGFFPWFLPTKPCALRSTQPLKMSTRDFSWDKGGRCVRLTTYHPCSAESREDPGP